MKLLFLFNWVILFIKMNDRSVVSIVAESLESPRILEPDQIPGWYAQYTSKGLHLRVKKLISGAIGGIK